MTVQMYLGIFVCVCIVVSVISFSVSRRVFREEIRKKIKLDISVKKMQECEVRIARFLADNNIQPGESIWIIANKLKIKPGNETTTIEGQAYLREPDTDGNMVVDFNKNLTQKEKLFALAHECAHVINNDPVPALRPVGIHKEEMEQVADYTAAALLLPYGLFYECLLQYNYENATDRKKLSIIRKICKNYGVGEVIVLRRIKEVIELNRIKFRCE